MDGSGFGGVPEVLAVGTDLDVDAPLLTYYDDASGERTELSAVGLGGWAARTAGLMSEGCGLAAGNRVAVLLQPHWQTAAVLLGAWSTGVSLSLRLRATAGLAVLGAGENEPLDAVFVSRDRLDDWLEDVPAAEHRFVLNLAPTAPAVNREMPAGYRDFLTEVSRYPGALSPSAVIQRVAPATVDGTTFAEWGALAKSVAQSLDLRAGDRLLVDAAEHEHPVKWLLAPLSVGASVVLCANLDRSKIDGRMAAEGVTRFL